MSNLIRQLQFHILLVNLLGALVNLGLCGAINWTDGRRFMYIFLNYEPLKGGLYPKPPKFEHIL